MSEYQVQTRICDVDGNNCQPAVWMPSTEIPTSDGWFGLEPGSVEYWEIANSFAILMAVVWGAKYLVRFASGRK